MRKKDFILIYVASHIAEVDDSGIAFGEKYSDKLKKKKQQALKSCIKDAKKLWKLIK